MRYTLGWVRSISYDVSIHGVLADYAPQESKWAAMKMAEPLQQEYQRRLDQLTELFLEEHFQGKNPTPTQLITLRDNIELGPRSAALFGEILTWVNTWVDKRVISMRAD